VVALPLVFPFSRFLVFNLFNICGVIRGNYLCKSNSPTVSYPESTPLADTEKKCKKFLDNLIWNML